MRRDPRALLSVAFLVALTGSVAGLRSASRSPGPSREPARIGEFERFRCPGGTEKFKKCSIKRHKENSTFIKSLTDRVLLCREKSGGRALVIYRVADPTPQSGWVARYGIVEESQDPGDPGTTLYTLSGQWDSVILKVYSEAEMALGRGYNAEVIFEQLRSPSRVVINTDKAIFGCN